MTDNHDRTITPDSGEWPDFAALADTPAQLWVRGRANLRAAAARSVVITGSRAATPSGEVNGADLAYTLTADGLTVISGGSYGVEAAAHRGALAAQGATIAVLACGLDAGYPAGHAVLFRTILDHGGLLVSAYPPGTPPTRARIGERNRLLAALSRGVLIVEADLRSGALDTARRAHELGKPVMAVPGPITTRAARGTNELIRSRTATLVSTAADVYDDTGLDPAQANPATQMGPTRVAQQP